VHADQAQRPLRVFLAGGTGFIGGHVLRALIADGHHVTCLVRTGSRVPAAHPNLKQIQGDWTRPEDWLTQVAGHDVVINTVGIIRERRQATFLTVQTTTPIALFNAAASYGVGKIVQISALGADETAVSRFHRSKRSADRHLAQLGVPFVVLRPSFVYGPGDHSMSFFRRLATLPLTPVSGDGQYRIQPLHVDDLTRAIVAAATDPALSDIVVDLGGAEALTFDDLLDRLACSSEARRPARKLHVPWPMMGVVASVTDLLGGRGPITSDELTMLRRGNVSDNCNFIERFGFDPRPFSG
jgi:uncharacterized protein YbjT (DUF2867 family)